MPATHSNGVTGISIVGGRYVYVRGLGERYSNTLLNNVEIPSPEPNRRVVPMDIFPANLLQSLQTVKTFSPDQPGNFAGGSVQVFTKDFPEALTMSLSMSTSFNTETTGARLEVSDQNVTTFDPLTAEAEPIEANLDTTDVLPSLNLTYRATERMNLRLAASRTLTRPDLREMAPFEFTDFIGGRTIFGNPNLERTQIDNYDLRWELFPQLGGMIAISGFYKKFRKPIEQIVQPAAEVRITYENAKAARNFGMELELRQNLSLIHSHLEHFSVNTNVALVSSEVELPNIGIQTSAQRALQGQSPYVVNATLGYDNPDLQVTGALAYHVFGRRIDEVGNHGIPDVYEQPRSQLDVTLARRIGSFLRLSFSAKNLLDPDVAFLQGDETYVLWRR